MCRRDRPQGAGRPQRRPKKHVTHTGRDVVDRHDHGIEGGPRVLASTLEDVRLCAARRAAQEESGKAFFAKVR